MAVLRIGSGWLSQRLSFRILSGYVLILGTMVLVLLLAISRLSDYSDRVVQSITQASPHIELGSAVARQIATVRLRVAQYLRTQAPVDYNAAIDALGQLGTSIEEAKSGLSDPTQTDPLRQVIDGYITYVDTFRDLVIVISQREQLYIKLLGQQTAIETRLRQLQKLVLAGTPMDVQVVEACNQVIAHLQLASNEINALRLQPRPDSVIWLKSELTQTQLWLNILSDHSGGLSSIARDLYHHVLDLHTQFQQNTASFLLLHEQDERKARESLEEVGGQLEQRSNDVLDQTLNALNTTAFSLARDAGSSQRMLLVMLVVAAGVSIFASLGLTISLTNPLRDLSRVVQAITAGNLTIRAQMKRRDEIGQLAAAFDQMTDSLQRSLDTERAANEQIRLQTLQIARQNQASAVTEERQRIARELHDSVKQQLFSISLSAGAALNLLTSDPDSARNYLEHLKQASREAQLEMKNLLQELVPAPLQEHRLEQALDQYLQSLCKVHRLELSWSASGANTLPITHEHALFRAAQEAIANVIRHSAACHLSVNLAFGPATTLIVGDDGCGFDPDEVVPGSTGLSTMRSRLERVGGSLEVQSSPGKGTRVEMIIQPGQLDQPNPLKKVGEIL